MSIVSVKTSPAYRLVELHTSHQVARPAPGKESLVLAVMARCMLFSRVRNTERKNTEREGAGKDRVRIEMSKYM